ncbi:MAG: hypothetical protein QS98_C0010G0071 [archaeon GW2011_AR3]|nr:MAG: hypothetical protein QS98_C0010G0071 [archaeon GW2011_AR3]MBS3110210.1 hypothetical protein [Candidatus Woesearchaeota archaeon]
MTSKEYNDFKLEIMPKHLGIYEKLCNWTESIIRIRPDKKREEELRDAIEITHLNITPEGAASFALIVPILFIILGSAFSLVMLNSSFFLLFFIVAGISLIFVFGKLPTYFANNWRLAASNQMVISVFYVVMHMRHTSNLENALQFAAEHLTGPLALDFKKVLWDAETEKYSSVKESLDAYLESWRKWNIEYIESFHLIESSLYEGSEDRRLSLLEKALEVMLDETYEKMLHYAQNLKSPITMLHMLGIVLPILGLVILPLIVSFMEEVKWYHIMAIYDILMPAGVYYLGKQILSSRPTGYGDSDISEGRPELKKYKNIVIDLGFTKIFIPPLLVACLIGGLLMFIGLSPVILHMLNPEFELEIGESGVFKLMNYKEDTNNPEKFIGPYGLIAGFLSIFVTLGLAVGIGIYYKSTSKNVYEIRKRTKQLEEEFASALFQLGNRLADGLPSEIAFDKVADTMQGTRSGDFFKLVSNNIRKLGMSVEQAIFDERVGAIQQFPSKVINSSMKVLTEASKKGPKIAAKAIINVSEYIKEIHRVNERLTDLMSETISSMKTQISFLSPVIAGIVIGITSMVTSILGSLGDKMESISSSAGVAGEQGVQSLSGFFGNGIPVYYFQIIVGVYVVQIIYILSFMVNGIENGSDKLNEQYTVGSNMMRAGILYSAIALIVMLIFNIIAAKIAPIGNAF